MVACSGCGEANRERAKFCSSCGAALTRRCAACGNELEAGSRFCDECGASTEAVESSGAVESVAEVRKVVTIVFADLAGSTALEERMDPESVRAVTQHYYALIRDVVEARGGHIVKFIGDGAMAVFGVPETHEDDALRALDAALAMHDSFAALAADVARERGAAIALRVGVNTGEVVVNTDDTDVVGDAVNLAARLEHAAASGGVLVGEATWRLTRGRATFGEMRELHVAGKADLVRAWPLTAVADDAVDLRTELVGRGAELGVLRDAFADVVETGTPRLVTVLGSPGVGKTRLASELERDVADTATVLVARCTQQTEAPFAPVADMLHAAVGGSAADPDDTVARLRALLDDDGDRDRVLAAVAAILAAGAAATPEESLWALRRLVEQRAQSQPVVFVVDDVQWAEALLLDLVEHLAAWTRGPLLLVLTARPELRERRAALADGARHAVVALEGLDHAATADLAKEILGARDLPVALLERLPASTGGNPLFVREMVRMLVDDDVLRAESDGSWELRVAPDAIDVPPTIQSLLSARLDRLTTDEQIVLERAAVWGTEVPVGALVDLLPPDVAPRLESVLELLRRKELMESAGSYWIDEPVHRFHHVLIRDAAYRRMLRDVRASLHERLADWVDTKTQSMETEFDELVGHHLEQAYLQRLELGPPDAHVAALGRTASSRLGSAAQRALDRDDPSAGPLTARALACLSPDDESRADLLLIRCDALLAVADSISARDAIAELDAIAASPRVSAWAECFAAQLATITDPAHLIETEQRAAAVAAELVNLGDARGAAKAHAVHAGALTRLGRFGDVEAALDRALTSARAAGDRRLATVALAAAPVAALWGPSPVPRAGGRCLDVVRLLRITAGSPVVEATSLRCQAVLEAFRGRYDAARRLVGSARAMVEELGLVHGLLETQLFSGIVELGAGDLDGAESCLRDAYDGLRALGADADAARAGALLARVALERGLVADAERLAREAESLAGDDLQAGISWRRVEAEVLARRGAHDEARALAEAAVAIASQTDALVHHADACAALAAVRRAAGDTDGATQAERQATELYERKGATALAVVEERSEPTPRPVLAALENRATRQLEAWRTCFARRDWDALIALVASDFVFDERRPLVGVRTVGRTPYRGVVRDLVALGIDELSFDIQAVRGERLLLADSRVAGEHDDVVLGSSVWIVIELAPDDLIASFVTFDDLDIANDELDRRYLEGEGAEHREMLELIFASNRAFNTRDWEMLQSTYASGIEYVDGVTAGWTSNDGREVVSDYVDEQLNEMPDVRSTLQVFQACSEDAAVATTLVTGTTVDGAHIERVAHLVYHRVGSAFDRLETFDDDHLDEALAAYRSLTATVGELTNRTVETYARYTELFDRQDWAAMRSVIAPGFRFDDRRRISQREQGAIEWRYLQEVADAGERFTARALATRGQRLAMLASETVGADFSSQSMIVVETDDAGMIVAVIVFDRDDPDAAVAELDARYIGGEGAPFAQMVRLVLDATRTLNARDWDAWRAVYAPDLVAVDSLSAGWGTYDNREDLRTAILNVTAVVDNPRSTIREIVACTTDAAVTSMVMSATLEDGAVVETHYYVVCHRRAATIDRIEVFDEDHREDALAAFRRVTLTIDQPRNRCLEVHDEWARCWARRDWDGMARIVARDFVLDDRRPIVGVQVEAPDAVPLAQRLASDGSVIPVTKLRALRGERLALVHTTFRSDDGTPIFHEDGLSVIELDADDRIASWVVYPNDELDAAIDELDRRYIEGEGAPYAAMLAALSAGLRGLNAGDFEAFATAYAPDFVFVDSTNAGWGATNNRDDFLATITGLFALFHDSRMTVLEVVACSTDGMVVSTEMSGTSADGGAIEFLAYNVYHWNGSAADRMELFDPEHRDDALAAFRRLTQAVTEPSNRCIAVFRRWLDLYAARDWAGMGDVVTENFEFDDLRPVTSWGGGLSPEAHMHSMAEEYDTFAVSVVAVRGERLAAVTMRGEATDSGAETFAAETIAVIAINEAGRFASFTAFLSDDLFGATAELERRFIAGEGAPYADLLNAGLRMAEAVQARDWERALLEYAPQITVVDHYTSGWSELRSGEDVLAALRAVYDVMPGAVNFEPEILGLRADAFLTTSVITAPGEDGEGVELAFRNILRRGPQGFDYIESFPFDQLDEALAAFERLGTPATELTNRCVEVFRRWVAMFGARDWKSMSTVVADDFVFDDRRPVSGWQTEPVDDYLHLLADDYDGLVVTVIAVRGERLAVVSTHGEATASGSATFAEVGIGVIELGDDDRLTAFVAYAVEGTLEAFAELDRRFIAGEGAPYATFLNRCARLAAAVNTREWARARLEYADQVNFVDHYTAGWSDMRSGDDVLAAVREIVDMMPGSVMLTTRIHALRADAMLNAGTFWLPGASDERVELAFLNLVHAGPNGFDRMETWAGDRLDDALAAFEALETAPDQGTSNECSRLVGSWSDAFAAREWERLTALLADHFVFDDTRSVVGMHAEGRDASIENLRVLANQGVERLAPATLAVRGERLALMELGVVSGLAVGQHGSVLAIYELNDDGRFATGLVFDPNELAAAFAELDRRFIAGEGAPYADLLTRCLRQYAAVNARDWTRARLEYAPRVTFVDHYSAGWSELRDSDDVLQAMRDVFANMSGAVLTTTAIHALSADAMVNTGTIMVPGGDDERVELPFLNLVHFGPQGLDHIETWAADRFDEGLAAFHALEATGELSNACTRLGKQWADAFAARDWDALGRIVDDDFSWDDRRSIVGGQATGRETGVSLMRIIAEQGLVRLVPTTLAVRGERLALLRVTGENAADVWERDEEAFVVFEADDVRLLGVSAFEDFGAAIAELDERFIAGEGAPCADLIRSTARQAVAFNARDWDRARREFAPNVVLVDHFWGGWNEQTDVDGVFGLLRSLISPNAVMYSAQFHALRPDAMVNTAVMRMLNADDDIEHISITFSKFGPDGFTRIETWPPGQLDEALAAFNRLENRCTTANDAVCRAIEQRDWEALRALYAPNFYGHDFRPGFSAFDDIDPVESFRIAADLGVVEVTQTPIAIRGEALALAEVVYRGRGDAAAEVRVLTVNEVDRDGRFVYHANFDIDEGDAATACLDARFAPVGNRAFRVFRDSVDALLRGDTDGFANGHSPDLRAEDRRSLLARVYGRDEMVNDFARRPDEAHLRMVAARGEDLELHHAHYRVGDWEFELLCVAELGSDGRIAETVNLDGDALDAAYAELDSRYLAKLDLEFAPTWRVAMRWSESFNARDWAEMADVQSPDVVFIDHGLAGYGRASRNELEALGVAFTDATPDVRMRFDQIEAIGAHGIVIWGGSSATNAAGGAFENMDWLVLGVANDRLHSIEVFPRDQLASAKARFEELP
jgi:class 3 adenylate cyclase/tetratricopeptide (TPR) repeat protein